MVELIDKEKNVVAVFQTISAAYGWLKRHPKAPYTVRSNYILEAA